MTKFVLSVMLLTAAAAGVAMYYFQVYAFYEEVASDVANVQLVDVETGFPSAVMFENFKGIDSDSSPLRYRACYTLTDPPSELVAKYTRLPTAEPRTAPGWFDCFDAAQIGADLTGQNATAFLGQENILYGIDRIVAVYPDGTAFSWHEINRCGEVVFDGQPAPDDCPPPPEGLR